MPNGCSFSSPSRSAAGSSSSVSAPVAPVSETSSAAAVTRAGSRRCRAPRRTPRRTRRASRRGATSRPRCRRTADLRGNHCAEPGRRAGAEGHRRPPRARGPLSRGGEREAARGATGAVPGAVRGGGPRVPRRADLSDRSAARRRQDQRDAELAELARRVDSLVSTAQQSSAAPSPRTRRSRSFCRTTRTSSSSSRRRPSRPALSRPRSRPTRSSSSWRPTTRALRS